MVLVLYGSQTGQAEAIARLIDEYCTRLDIESHLMVMADCSSQLRIEKESLVVLVVSSTGDGDAPDNAAAFVRFICKRSLSENLLNCTQFALLGLGDSNYSTYQGVPRLIEKHLLRLGAKPFIPTGAADDQIGLELGVEPWIHELCTALVSFFNMSPNALERIFTTLEMSGSEYDGDDGQKEGDGMCFEEDESPNELILKSVPFQWPVNEPCLIHGNDDLHSDQALRVSVPPLPFLSSSVSHFKLTDGSVEWQNGCKLAGACDHMQAARVVATAELTYAGCGKPKRELQLDIHMDYEPGDAVYVAVANPRQEVNLILQRCALLEVADQQCSVVLHPRTEKRNAVVPLHVPQLSSLRYLFTYCLDIRRTPGRPLLRVLVNCCSDAHERRRLLELCSAQGNAEFTQFVRQNALSLADVLFAFPSCKPSIDRLIELVPRLMPRAYSVASSPLHCGRRMRLVYSMLAFEPEQGRRYYRHGLCSDYLASLQVGDTLQVALKAPSRFRLPTPSNVNADITKIPLLLIGPGTGIAPFLSFLQHILEKSPSNTSCTIQRELYTGCRSWDVDGLYRHELDMYRREGILSHMALCESRPLHPNGFKYVQDAIEARGKQIADLLCTEREYPAVVYVCGDAKAMSRDVWNTFIQLLVSHKGVYLLQCNVPMRLLNAQLV